MSLKSYFLRTAYFVKRKISELKLFVGIKLGFIKKVMIMPYKGFGNDKEVYILGRVMKDRGIRAATSADSSWHNFKMMYKRFMTWTIPYAHVKARFAGDIQVVPTDEEGYFEFRLRPKQSFGKSDVWQTVQLELIDEVVPRSSKVLGEGKVYVPEINARYGVVSDIDDTIVPTGATRLWTMIKITFLNNALSRLPFPGIAALYDALKMGGDLKGDNPFFYVSSSPWNLYDFLSEFLTIHKIPNGPLMLRDIGLSREHLIAGSHKLHKLTQIEHIFEVFQNLDFILIGDSGQEDPEIYLQVIKDYPGRVKRIYIRNVSTEAREKKVVAIAEEMRMLGVELVLAKDTFEVAEDAVKQGYIASKSLMAIRNQVDGAMANG
ncbi:App1 family protein [Anditalea andensis]|uniref:ABC transporter ATPase n=1 Tax=Anditalea andensis TaxID=1048983 RepID=A0A074KXD6_9BACT|nr:phosphatase domain-containing protein [Anditalea andensis]KEO72900.1 ABC transporter ATPase [Anditalea andensis]